MTAPVDPRERFSATVDAYRRYRPDYPVALFEWLDGLSLRMRRAADVGAGTGILTRALAERGWDVVGIEPNADMRAAAIAAGGARYVAGTAEALPLPDRSVDLVIGAQAFHWFDLGRALAEIDRVGVGLAVAVWNVRLEAGFSGAYERILEEHSPDYARVPKPDPTIAALRALRPAGTAVAFPHGQELDQDGVIGRAWSSSYVVHGVSDRPAFDRALLDAFAAHARDGRVELAYETRGWAWPTRAA